MLEGTAWDGRSHERDDYLYPGAPVERPQRPFRYREHEFSGLVCTPANDGDQIPSSYSMQHVSYLINPSTSLNYQSMQEEPDPKNVRHGMMGQAGQFMMSEKKP